MSKVSTLTQKYIKRVLDYDKHTGLFTWKITCSNRAVKGTVAGCIASDGYVALRVNKINVRAHRLAYLYMTGSWPIQ